MNFHMMSLPSHDVNSFHIMFNDLVPPPATLWNMTGFYIRLGSKHFNAPTSTSLTLRDMYSRWVLGTTHAYQHAHRSWAE